MEIWQDLPIQDKHFPIQACEQAQSPYIFQWLRTKLFSTQTTSQINNTRSPRNRFVTFLWEFISSEQMIFLCLFKKQAVPRTDASIIQTIEQPSGHSSAQHVAPPASAARYPVPLGPPAPGPEVRFWKHSLAFRTRYSQTLPSKSTQDEPLKKHCREQPIFFALCIQTWKLSFLQINPTPAKSKSETCENMNIDIQKQSFLPEVLFLQSMVKSHQLVFHLFQRSLLLFPRNPGSAMPSFSDSLQKGTLKPQTLTIRNKPC